jgi:hypothetical protein
MRITDQNGRRLNMVLLVVTFDAFMKPNWSRCYETVSAKIY